MNNITLEGLQEAVDKIGVLAERIKLIKLGKINEILANDPDHMCWVAEVKEEMRLQREGK